MNAIKIHENVNCSTESTLLPSSKNQSKMNNQSSSSPVFSSTSTSNKLHQVANLLLNTPPQFNIVYTYNNHNHNPHQYYQPQPRTDNAANDPFVKIVVKQAVSNIVKILYMGELISYHSFHHVNKTTLPTSTLLPTASNNNNNNNTTCYNNNSNSSNTNNDNGMLLLLQSISNSYNQSQQLLHQTKQTQIKTQTQLYFWKDTATKLEQSWQDEKNELLQNYLVLLNSIKGHLRIVKDELKCVQEKNTVLMKQLEEYRKLNTVHSSNNVHGHTTAGLQLSGCNRNKSLLTKSASTSVVSLSSAVGGVVSSSSSSSNSSTILHTKRSKPDKSIVLDHEDEHDCAQFEEYEIDALASGKRIKTPPASAVVKNKSKKLRFTLDSTNGNDYDSGDDDASNNKDENKNNNSSSNEHHNIKDVTKQQSSTTTSINEDGEEISQKISVLANPFTKDLMIFPNMSSSSQS